MHTVLIHCITSWSPAVWSTTSPMSTTPCTPTSTGTMLASPDLPSRSFASFKAIPSLVHLSRFLSRGDTILMDVSFSLQVFQGVQRGRKRTCREAYGVPGIWRLSLLDLFSFMTADFITFIRKYCSFIYLVWFGKNWINAGKSRILGVDLSLRGIVLTRMLRILLIILLSTTEWSLSCSSLSFLIVSHVVIEQAWRKSKAEHHLVASDGVWPCWERGCSLL